MFSLGMMLCLAGGALTLVNLWLWRRLVKGVSNISYQEAIEIVKSNFDPNVVVSAMTDELYNDPKPAGKYEIAFERALDMLKFDQ